ncbi:putative reverse transcriptase zinc-binding domain-containing protein [Helianthus anomalus]
MRWVKWNVMLKSKLKGGFGIGNMADFNIAMMSKWWWRFKDDPTQLWAAVIQAIHKSKVDSKLIPAKKSIPGAWKDISAVEGTLSRCGLDINQKLKVQVGNGKKVRFWKDNWIHNVPLRERFPALFKLAKNKDGMVHDHLTMVGSTVVWQWAWVRGLSTGLERNQIACLSNLLRSAVITADKQDRWSWVNNEGTSFSVKGVRMEVAAAVNDGEQEDRFFWNSWAPLKHNYFLWRVIKNKVAAKSCLAKRGILMHDMLCERCGIGIEDVDHVFINCLWARSIWWQVAVWLRIPPPISASSLKEVYKDFMDNIGSARWHRIVHLVILATVWRIWHARNLKVFEGRFIPTRRILDFIKEDAFLWVTHRSNLPNPDWEKWIDFNVADLL